MTINVDSLLQKFSSARSKQAAPGDAAPIQNLNPQQMTDRVLGASNYPQVILPNQNNFGPNPYALQAGDPGYADGVAAHPFEAYQDYGIGFNEGAYAHPLWNAFTNQTGTGLGGAALNAALGYGGTRLLQNYSDVFNPAAYQASRGGPQAGIGALSDAASLNLVGRLTAGQGNRNPFAPKANLTPAEPNLGQIPTGQMGSNGKPITIPAPVVSAVTPSGALSAPTARVALTSPALRPQSTVASGIVPGTSRTQLTTNFGSKGSKGTSGSNPATASNVTARTNLPTRGVQLTRPALGGRIGIPTRAGLGYAMNPLNPATSRGWARNLPWYVGGAAALAPFALNYLTEPDRPATTNALVDSLLRAGPSKELGGGLVTQPGTFSSPQILQNP